MTETPPALPKTTLGRAALALLAGAVVGAVLTALAFAASAYLFPQSPEARSVGFDLGQAGVWGLIFLVMVLFWIAGLAVIGAPLWVLLHRLGHRARLHAMMLGALATGVSGYVLGVVAISPLPIAWFLTFALIGAATGELIRKIAYR